MLLIQGDHNSSTQIPEISVVLLKSPEFPLKKYGHPYPENKAIFFEERFKTKSFRLRSLFKTSFRLLVLFKRNCMTISYKFRIFRGKKYDDMVSLLICRRQLIWTWVFAVAQLAFVIKFRFDGAKHEYFVPYTVSIIYLRQISLFNTTFFIARAFSATSMRVRKCKIADNCYKLRHNTFQ